MSKYIVRFFDGFDYKWIDVSEPSSKEEAERIWNEYTNNRTIKTNFDDIDYYMIFPSDRRMIYAARDEKGNDIRR